MGGPEPARRQLLLPQRPLDFCTHVGVVLNLNPPDERRTGPLGHDIRVPPSPQRPGGRATHHRLLVGQRRGQRVKRRGMWPIAQGDRRRPQQTTSLGPSQR